MKTRLMYFAYAVVAMVMSISLVACGGDDDPTPQKVKVVEIKLNKIKMDLLVGASETLTSKVLPADATDKSCKWTSSNEAVATVDVNGKVTGIDGGTATITCVTNDGSNLKAECIVTVFKHVNGHAYVEIGGAKWATMNVGATTVAGSLSTCFGDYYAWSETEPRYTGVVITDENNFSVNWKDYAGYSDDYPPSYTGNTLDAAHDVATQLWGSQWHMPSVEDFKNLYVTCGGTLPSIDYDLPVGSASTKDKGIYWCDNYDGVKGVLFSDGINKLFFPAAGDMNFCNYYQVGKFGFYWSSTRGDLEIYPNLIFNLTISSNMVAPSDRSRSAFGFTIRPVAE